MSTTAPTPPAAPVRIESGPPAHPIPRIVLTPETGWSWVDLVDLWIYRELIFFIAWRDIKVRYKQTVLGAAWAILQPLMMMIVFSIFFGRMAGMVSGATPYPLFALAGLLPWNFFATAVNLASNSVIGSERLITKVYFPRLTLPLASVGAPLVDFLVASTLLGGLMVWYQVRPGVSIFLLPIIFVVTATLAVGLGTWLAALNVAFRDFKYVIPFFLQLGMFATPAIYMDLTRPQTSRYAWLLALNPMNALVAGFRGALLDSGLMWLPLLLSLVVSLTILISGVFYFRRVEDSFADII